MNRDAPDTDLAVYPANFKSGYRKSGKAGYPAGYSAQHKDSTPAFLLGQIYDFQT
jgi:hypothetical protein